MASSTDVTGAIHRWVERKPLTEAVSWTSREKFWLITATCHYGINDWKSVAQVVKNAGEPYRPKEWYSPKNCERQFKILISNLNKEIRLLPFRDMMQNIAEGLKNDYIRDTTKSKDVLKAKYCNLFSILNRVKQGNLSRNEIVSLYSQARRNEIEGNRYMEQLMTRQNASLASENSSSGLSDEPIKWNTPSAPLLTSLLRSRNTIPGNRAVTSIGSLIQSPGGSPRTRSGKLLPLSQTVTTKITQGTPTLSKLLEAPANPYIQSPPQSALKNRQSEVVGEDELVGNTSKKENVQSFLLNKVRVDNQTSLVSFNQINKADLSFSKRQLSKNVLPEVNNGSKANSNIVNLLSDSENDDDINSFQNILPKNLFDENNDINITSRLEPRATRSQTRAEGGSFKHSNISKLFDGKKDQETSKQESEEIQITENHSIDGDDLIDIDQIDIEPLPSIQDEVIAPTSSKITRSSMLRTRVNNSTSIINKGNNKEINNQMLEEISANFVLSSKNVGTEYTNVLVGQSRIDSSNISGCLIPVDASTVKDALLLCKDNQSFSNSGNTLATFNGKLIKQKRVIELKPANIKCIDARKEHKYISFANQPIVVVNKIKKPFNIKLAPELKDKTDDIKVMTNDQKKNLKLHSHPQNVVQLLDTPCSFSDEVIVIEDDVNINVDEPKSIESNKVESQNLLLATITSNNSINSNSKAIKSYQPGNKKDENDKTQWKVFGKHQSLSNISFKKSDSEDSDHKVGINSNIKDTNNRFIKELEFDFDQSISETSLSELYNGVEEVEMHSFDNEELNSLIECGSPDNNVIEKRQNTINMDQGDSSVSESDSNIGAFDTFAQITRVSQKSSSKEAISINSELKIVKQDGTELRHDEGFVRTDGLDDDQTSALSVTGIPVLQGVISDVMSKINSDRVAALKTDGVQNVSLDDIVEISSDEEDSDISTQQLEEEEKAKLKINDLSKIGEHGTKIAHGVNNKYNKISMYEKSISKDITIIRPIINKKTFNILNNSVANNKEMESAYSKNKLDLLEANKNNIETRFVRIIEDDITRANKKKIENEWEAGIKKTKELELKVSEQKLQCEEIFKNIKESEERKKTEAEEKKKIENEVQKKKEDEERKKKEEDEERKKNEAEEKRIKDDEHKKKIEVEEKRIKDDEQKKKIEAEEKKKNDEKDYIIKENEDKKIKDEERKKMKDKEDDEKNKIKKDKDVQEAENKTFEAEIIKRVETGEITKKYYKFNINQGFESEKNKPNSVMKKARIAEMSKVKESLTKQIVEIHVPKLDIKKMKTSELSNMAKEADVIRSREARMVEEFTETERKRIHEANVIKSMQVAVEKAKVAELQTVEAAKIQETKVEFQKAKETELKKNKVLEYKKSKEEEIKSAKFEEMKSVQFECLIQREKEAEEEDKAKKAESRKVMEADMKGKEDKKAKEVEINKKIEDPVSKLRGDKKNIEEQPKKSKKSERLNETRINNVKETGNTEPGTPKLKEEELKQNVEIEAKQTKETENKITEVKIITRTRGSKAEEKHKQFLESKSPFTKSGTTIKCLSSSTYSTSSGNSPISSNNDGKKSIKNIDGNNHNIGSKSKVDIGKNSSERVSNENDKKEDIQQETTSTSRTRSSLTFKSGKSKETKSKSLNLCNEQNIVIPIPKCNTGPKTITETSSSSAGVNHQLDSEIFIDKLTSKHKFSLHSTNLYNRPISDLNSMDPCNEELYHNFSPLPDFTSVKQLEDKDKLQKKIDVNEKPEVLAPKKRGRKRRINVLNNSQPVISDIQTLPISVSPSNVGEPLAKRTRSSLESRKKESNDHAFTKPEKWKKYKLKKYLNNICKEASKQDSSFEKKMNELESPFHTIIKNPVVIKHIKRQINAGIITHIDEFIANIHMLCCSLVMLDNFGMNFKSAFNGTDVSTILFVANPVTNTHENHDNSEYSRDNVSKNKDAANKKAIARVIKNLGSVVEPNLSSSIPPKKRRRRNISSDNPNINDPEISC